MTIAAIVVLLIVLGVIAALAFTRIAPDAILVAALTALMVVPVPDPQGGGWSIGILSVSEALGGFSNAGLATVAALFIVVAGLRETGGVDFIAGRVLGRPRTVRGAIGRVVFPVAGVSAFLNNTPVVAMMIPAIADWSKRMRIPASKLMIPLSYASIIGGTCSLIGTSTNLVVAGLVIAAGLTPLGMFDITWVGLPTMIAGALFLIVLGPVLLPARQSASESLADPREYTMELIVPAGSALAGKTVAEAGLRNLPGCYLVEIDRGESVMSAVGPDESLAEGDRLIFAGVVDAIRDLANLRGLAPATNQVFKLDAPRYRRRLFEAVISEMSPIVGLTIKQARFRNRYDGAVIAVARQGRRVTGKIGDIMVRPGDTLLIEADPGFAERNRNARDFLLVSALEDSTPRRHERAPLAIAILIAMVAIATTGIVSMLEAALVAGGVMIATRCCTLSEARRNVDWSVLIVIGAALGLGSALDISGAADSIAGGIIAVAGSNPWLILLAIYLVTSLMTEVITNNAAVALTFPFAITIAERMGLDPMAMIIAIMMAGSASFATPLGYQTNLMVYGPGGYRFSDFLRIGIPMNLLVAVVTVTLAPIIWPMVPATA
ncbi:MAG: SLC13 family permease [Phycisphaerales bacterium]